MSPLLAALAALKSTDAYALAKARALLTVYHETWAHKWADYEIIDAEVEFAFPLLNPETGAASRTFMEAGKMDVLAKYKPTGRIIVIEHKTTAGDVTPESDYWDRLRMDTQVSKYYLAAAQSGKEVGGVLYDVISKPGQRPSKVPLIDADGFKQVFDKEGNRVFTKDGKKPRETGDAEKGWEVLSRPESPDEYEARVLEVLRAAPHEYFAQRNTPRLDSDILEYMADAWALSQQVLYFRNQKLWPRNPAACDQFGKCEMFDLCAGRSSVDSIRYRRRDNVHAELKIQNSDGKELLTNSRGSALKRCSRYHFLRYEDGVERVGEESEALSFGTLIHQGLEAYFLNLKTLGSEEVNREKIVGTRRGDSEANS